MDTPVFFLLGLAAWITSAPLHAQTPAWTLAKSETLPAPEGLTHHAQTVAGGSGGNTTATLHFVSFDATRNTFAVYDQGDLGRNNLGEALTKHHALAGTNGGFFQPDFQPVGLLLAGGKLVEKPARNSRLLSGALVVTEHHVTLRRSQEPLPGRNARQAVQAGPFLVEFGKTIPGLNDVRSARRTAVFTDGRLRWGLLATSALTLAELGQILADPALLPQGMEIDKALNLDGGSSTALWVQQPGQAPFYTHELGIVRDFVGIVPR